MKKVFLALLAIAVVPFVRAEEDDTQPVREIELAQIKIQRVDPDEIRWGTKTDIGELTYSVYSDGTVAGWVGTTDGMKMMQDPDALRVIKVKKLDPSSYIIYPDQPVDAMTPVLQTGDNEFSLWNYISGTTTNHWGRPGLTGETRTLNVQSLTDNTRIAKIELEIEDHPYTGSSVPGMCSRTRYEDLQSGKFKTVHTLKFSSGYMNMNDNPPGCTVKNIVVYGYDGELDSSEIDASIIGITVKEQDGRSYDLGKIHMLVEGIHKVQDRWAYYPAACDVSLTGHKLYMNDDQFIWIQGDDGLGMKVSTDVGDLMTFDRGNRDGGALIKGFDVNTNNTCSIYVTPRFSGNFVVYGSTTVDGTYSQIQHVNNGITTFNGSPCYELVVPGTETSYFYKVSAVVADDEIRGPSISIHVDKLYFGPNGVELSINTISNGTDSVSFLSTGSIGAAGGGGGGGLTQEDLDAAIMNLVTNGITVDGKTYRLVAVEE